MQVAPSRTHADRWRQAGKAVAVWLPIWWAPVAVAALTLGADHVLVQIGVFFSKLAVVTFGGAYALLAYMAQAVVEILRLAQTAARWSTASASPRPRRAR